MLENYFLSQKSYSKNPIFHNLAVLSSAQKYFSLVKLEVSGMGLLFCNLLLTMDVAVILSQPFAWYFHII